MADHSRPGRGPLAGSVAIHVSAVVAAFVVSAVRPEPMVFETYAVEIYSPPPQVEAAEPTPPPEELVVERPQEDPPEPEPPPPAPEPEPDPPPRPEPEPAETPPPPPPEPEQAPAPASGPEADPSSAGGEDMVVRMEGLRRDYPAYYDNIIRQITRCFRWTGRGGRWETTVYFVITRDGAVPSQELRFVTRSGNGAFDIEAIAAVECAGRAEGFGPLPADMPSDRLPVQFTFRPRGEGR